MVKRSRWGLIFMDVLRETANIKADVQQVKEHPFASGSDTCKLMTFAQHAEDVLYCSHHQSSTPGKETKTAEESELHLRNRRTTRQFCTASYGSSNCPPCDHVHFPASFPSFKGKDVVYGCNFFIRQGNNMKQVTFVFVQMSRRSK